jgi:uncharacterized membrane protein YqaE (UPF0057 family)
MPNLVLTLPQYIPGCILTWELYGNIELVLRIYLESTFLLDIVLTGLVYVSEI